MPKYKETYSGKEKMSQRFYIQEECLSIIKGRDKSLLKSKKLVKIIPESSLRNSTRKQVSGIKQNENMLTLRPS